MTPSLAEQWLSYFFAMLEGDPMLAAKLRDASLQADLKTWTAALTTTVVRSFEAMGLATAAKGHRCSVLPIAQQEYLGQDVMAFASGAVGWRFPVAVSELENAGDDDRVAYSLWKTLCVRAQLRVVFCYRAEPSASPALVSILARMVVGALALEARTRLEGETVVVVGSHNEASTFPYGFFQTWKLNINTGRFERLVRR